MGLNLGTTVKCPNIVKNIMDDDVPCGYEGYELLEKGIYTKHSGYDPLACRVKCRRCGHIYIVFPAVKFMESETLGGKG